MFRSLCTVSHLPQMRRLLVQAAWLPAAMLAVSLLVFASPCSTRATRSVPTSDLLPGDLSSGIVPGAVLDGARKASSPLSRPMSALGYTVYTQTVAYAEPFLITDLREDGSPPFIYSDKESYDIHRLTIYRPGEGDMLLQIGCSLPIGSALIAVPVLCLQTWSGEAKQRNTRTTSTTWRRRSPGLHRKSQITAATPIR